MRKNPIFLDLNDYMVGMRVSVIEKPDKGLKGGSCNRIDCQAPGANCYNKGTMQYYCKHCAMRINDGNNLNLCDIQQDTRPIQKGIIPTIEN